MLGAWLGSHLDQGIKNLIGEVGQRSVGAGQASISNFDNRLLGRLLHTGVFPFRLQTEIFQVGLEAVQQSLNSLTVGLRGHAVMLPFSSEDTKLII